MRSLVMTVLTILALGSVQAEEIVTVRPVEFPTPPASWPNFALSYDGSRMACYLDNGIYLYEDGVFQYLGVGDPLNSQIGISADGRVIVSSQPNDNGVIEPTIWREADGWAATRLGSLPGAESCDNSFGTGYAVNQDGSVVVGLAWLGCDAVAFRWTEAGGMENIGGVRASAISASGTAIAGFTHGPGSRRAVYWQNVPGGGFTGPLGIGSDQGWSEAWGTSSDGSIILGEYTDWTTNVQAFLYTEAEGLRQLGTVEDNPEHSSMANFMSDDGKVIGRSGTSGPWGVMKASIWREGEGMQYLEDYIAAHATELPPGFAEGSLRWAPALSADGSLAVVQWMDDLWNFGYYFVEFASTVANEEQAPPVETVVPAQFALAQNWPNPFNPATTIAFTLPRAERVNLAVYDLTGRLVRTLQSGTVGAGEHEVVWQGTDAAGAAVPSGTYVYRLVTESNTATGTMTLVK